MNVLMVGSPLDVVAETKNNQHCMYVAKTTSTNLCFAANILLTKIKNVEFLIQIQRKF